MRTTARILLGLLFLVMGLNGFFYFLPAPAELPPKVVAFVSGMAATGYLVPLISATEALAGVLLLANRYVPLALVVLAPILVNIIFYHAFLSPAMGTPVAAVAVLLELYLAWTYRDAFRSLLEARSPIDVRTAHGA
jgi:uncharacterized membrane protein YphA (DoxX/SURF4 family)